MHGVSFLHDLAVVMIVAGLVTVVFHQVKQPVVLGYILAGVIIGPHLLPFPLVEDQETIKTLAELGIVFLLFSLGLEFNLRKLTQVGATAFIATPLEILLMAWLGYEIGLLFGWSQMDSVFLGAIISISSTTIIVRTLGEMGKTKEKFAQLIFGILIVEDILAIVMIALLSGIATTGSLSAVDVFLTLEKLVIFLVTLLVAGLLIVPRLLGYVAKFKSSEMLLISVLGLLFGVSLLAVELGYSVALGAFIIGAVIAEAREIGKIETLMEPMRDMFSAVFFVAIGSSIDPRMLLDYAWPIAVITLAVAIGKIAGCTFGTFVAGHDMRTALRVGTGLSQIGEFSFIIASLGLTLKVTSEFLYPIAVTVSAVTSFTTPYSIRGADRLVEWFHRAAPPRLVRQMEIYTQWVGHWRRNRKHNMAARLAKKWAWQMLLNILLICAVFIVAVFVSTRPPAWLLRFPGQAEGMKTFLWLGSVILTLPLFIATFRKLQALGLLVSEMSVSRAAAGAQTKSIRAVIAQTIPLAGLLGLALLVIVLSSTLLPPMNVLWVLLVVIALVTWLLWRSFVNLYSRAQFALTETFAQPPPPRHHEEKPELKVLKEAQLETIAITDQAPACGKLIRELQLRTATGASIVAIQRDGQNMINPGPDEEIQRRDQILLLGSRPQLEAARKLLTEAPGGSESNTPA